MTKEEDVERIAGLILAAIQRHEEAQTVAEAAARAKFESGEMALFERDPVAWKKAHGKYQSGPPVFYFRCSRAKVADLVQSAVHVVVVPTEKENNNG